MYVVERHYSTNIAELHKQFEKDWEITKRTKVIDNARNIASAVNHTGYVHFPCLAHSLQLSISMDLKPQILRLCLSNVEQL